MKGKRAGSEEISFDIERWKKIKTLRDTHNVKNTKQTLGHAISFHLCDILESEQISSYQGLEVGQGLTTKGPHKEIFCEGATFLSLIVGVVT